MIRSMTGFGAGRVLFPGGEVRVEVSGVNGRGLAVKFRLAEALSSSQAAVESRVRERVVRGTLTVSAEVRRGRDARPRLDLKALEGYVKAFETARKRLPSLPPPDWGTLTALPGVLSGGSGGADAEPALLKALDAALKAFLKDREREGRSLGRICGRILSEAESALARADARRAPALEAFRSRLSERLSAALAQSALPAGDDGLRRELVLHAERSDVAEEVDRLRVHLAEAQRCLESSEPSGRRLDFLAQEMMREANTLGSKAADAALSTAAVDLKTALDRFKEQVQNLE